MSTTNKPTTAFATTTALLRASSALDMDIVEALEDREPLPEEIAADEHARCKYLSKKCLRQRATKAKGELHKLCTFHRAKAIVNQRRLELRKRARHGGDDAVAIDSIEIVSESPTRAKKPLVRKPSGGEALIMLPAISVSESAPVKTRRPPYRPSPRDVHDIEPCMTPATLFPEDLEELRGLADLDMADNARRNPYAMDVVL